MVHDCFLASLVSFDGFSALCIDMDETCELDLQDMVLQANQGRNGERYWVMTGFI